MIIDDEPMAIDLLQDYVSRVPSLELTGSCRDAVTALEELQARPVDLLFLDIDMPDLTGIQLLKSLPRPPLVIFTTAHAEYAVESYEYQAVDYLLKPIRFERFLKAVHKALEHHRPGAAPGAAEPLAGMIFIKSGTDIHPVDVSDLLYVEGAGNYVSFVTTEKTVLSLMSMTAALELLPERSFVRIHRSYIVAVRHIGLIETDHVRIGDRRLPVGEKFRKNLSRLYRRDG
jgi:DNA-binding LytR/AlgR family response regulator